MVRILAVRAIVAAGACVPGTEGGSADVFG
jgi:hypothetical protein